MIERYALSPIKDIWTQEEQYRRWLEVELAVVQAKEDLGLILKGITETMRQKARIDVPHIHEIEQEVDHDMIACEQTDRDCYTIELDEKYCDVIVKRYIEQAGSADGVSVERDGKTYTFADLEVSDE